MGQERIWASWEFWSFVSQLSLASRRFPTGDTSHITPLAMTASQLHPRPPPGLTSEGLQVAVPPGAGLPTAEAGSWSSCAGRSCQSWHVVVSSAGVPHSLSPEAGKLCSLAGLGSYTASRWAGWAAPCPLGSLGPRGKGCPVLRLVPVQLGCHWLSPEAHSGLQASLASSLPSHSLGHHPPLESWSLAQAWGGCCAVAGGGVCWVGCSLNLVSRGCRLPRETL